MHRRLPLLAFTMSDDMVDSLDLQGKTNAAFWDLMMPFSVHADVCQASYLTGTSILIIDRRC
jgi:hypothetical protein